MGAQCAHPHSIQQNTPSDHLGLRRREGERQTRCLSRRPLVWEQLAHLFCSYSVKHSEDGKLFLIVLRWNPALCMLGKHPTTELYPSGKVTSTPEHNPGKVDAPPTHEYHPCKVDALPAVAIQALLPEPKMQEVDTDS